MAADKDFSRVLFKVNVSGSWANLVSVPSDRYDEVKAACATLASAHGPGLSIKFKALDADGGLLEIFESRNCTTGWHS